MGYENVFPFSIKFLMVLVLIVSPLYFDQCLVKYWLCYFIFQVNNVSVFKNF